VLLNNSYTASLNANSSYPTSTTSTLAISIHLLHGQEHPGLALRVAQRLKQQQQRRCPNSDRDVL
jgi:hypothetical protein